jgi:hypothetical protein
LTTYFQYFQKYLLIIQPCDLHQNATRTPVWNESIVLNEEFLHICRENVVIIFQVLDFATVSKLSKHPWYPIAWGFLKICGKEKANVENICRLQLYRLSGQNALQNVFQLLDSKKVKYPSSLYISVKSHSPIAPKKVFYKPKVPLDQEISKITFEDLLEGAKLKLMQESVPRKSIANLNSGKSLWNRRPGEPCEVPNSPLYQIETSKGSFACKFSNTGRLLAVACVEASSYPINLYTLLDGERVASLLGHQSLVYQLSWEKNDRSMISCSSDGSVRRWIFHDDCNYRESYILNHTGFVYSCIFDMENNILTGASDGVIRQWNGTEIMFRYTGHGSAINCLAIDESYLYSGDNSGELRIWKKMGDCFKSFKSISFQVCHYNQSVEFFPLLPPLLKL